MKCGKKAACLWILVAFVCPVFCNPAPDPFRRSDLFLDAPFHFGLPPKLGHFFDDAAKFVGGFLGNSHFDVQIHGKETDEVDENQNEDMWPGHKIAKEVVNQGKDILDAFESNLAKFKPTFSKVLSLPKDIKDKLSSCATANECQVLESLTDQDICRLGCLLKDNTHFTDAVNGIYQGVKSICHTTDTFFTKIKELGINDLDTFKTALQTITEPVQYITTISTKSMVAKLMNELLSVLSPYKPLVELFKKNIKTTEPRLGISNKKKLLVTSHPGCAMINMSEPLALVQDIMQKDKSLVDYLVFQGYTLFSAVTKYIQDFNSKNWFAAVTEGLNIVLGTTCGIYEYATSGEKSDCDQYGGHPVLGMPIGKFIWGDKKQEACEVVLEKVLHASRGKTEQEEVPLANDELEQRRRKKRSLALGHKDKSLLKQKAKRFVGRIHKLNNGK